MIKLFELIPFCLAAVPANRTDIQHAIPELYEGPSFYWDVQICYVMQQKVYQLLQFVLAKPGLQALDCKELSLLVGHKTILSKEVINLALDCVGTSRCIRTVWLCWAARSQH